MAEVVNSKQERTIPEYELMEKHQVFTTNKIKDIIKTRENYQYKLSKNAKTLKDYGEFILYEKEIYSMIQSIERSRNEQFPGLKLVMSQRIIRLYKEALRGYPEENRLWEAYLKFCKINFPSEVGNAYESLIQKQGEKPSVWCSAGLWFYEHGNNIEKVKNYFYRGIQRHPESTLLYTAFFSILLADTSIHRVEARPASLNRVMGVYNVVKKKIWNVKFLTNLVNQCDDERYISFSKPLQKLIINDMMEMHPRDESVWDLLARRELRGASVSDFLDKRIVPPEPCENKENNGSCDKVVVQKNSLKRRIEMCFSIYQTAVYTLKTPTMWSMFINAMMDLNTDLTIQPVLKRKKLAIALRGAHENDCMSEDHYYAYINLLTESNSNRDFIVSVMNDATKNCSSFKLWEQRLSFHIMENDDENVYKVFRMGTRKLGAEGYSLWKLAVQYYQTRYNEHYFDRLEEIFKEASMRPEPVFATFRAQYLEWSIANKQFHSTRRLYTELIKLTPPCLELHQRMMKLESQAFNPDIEKIRLCHENAVMDFGKLRTDVWIDLIKFELNEGDPKRIPNLCERAQQTLDPKHVDKFISEHCILTIGD